MAEFDAGGFSAVAAFFGEGKGAQKEHSSSAPTPSESRGGRRNRLGLGATATGAEDRQSARDGLVGDGIGKKILRVGAGGRKGRGGGDDGDDDDVLGSVGGGDGIDREGEGDGVEEEEGRTAIKSRPKRKLDATTIIEGEEALKKEKKKKKKAGKKERLAAAKAAEEEVSARAELPVEPTEDAIDQVTREEGEEAVVSAETKRAKRKKPKVRSRQKNIRKDNRLTQNKPEHLILGRPTYSGRALTPETRQRLKLPESKTSRRAHKHHKDGGDASSAGVTNNAFREIGLGLAVDDLLDVGVAADGKSDPPIDVAHKPKNRKEEKRKKKTKYKNLA